MLERQVQILLYICAIVEVEEGPFLKDRKAKRSDSPNVPRHGVDAGCEDESSENVLLEHFQNAQKSKMETDETLYKKISTTKMSV